MLPASTFFGLWQVIQGEAKAHLEAVKAEQRLVLDEKHEADKVSLSVTIPASYLLLRYDALCTISWYHGIYRIAGAL